MLKTLVTVFAPSSSDELDMALKQLNQALYTKAQSGSVPWQNAARALRAFAEKMLPVLEKVTLDRQSRMKILLALIDASRISGYADYSNAEQAYMAIIGVVHGLLLDGSIKLTPDMRATLSNLKLSLAHDEKYSVKLFEQHLTLFRNQLAKPPGAPR